MSLIGLFLVITKIVLLPILNPDIIIYSNQSIMLLGNKNKGGDTVRQHNLATRPTRTKNN